MISNPPDRRRPEEDERWNRVKGITHSRIYPVATYSPWLDDSSFAKVYEDVRDHTLVDLFRCYALWESVSQCAKVAGDILEIGVWRGGTGALLAARAKQLGHGTQVYLADTFRGVVKTGDRDPIYSGGEHAVERSAVEALLKRLRLFNVCLLEGTFPDDTGATIQDRTFALCHIDVDAYQSASDCLNWVWPRLSNGGMVVFDDYGFSGCEGVTKLLQERRDDPECRFVHNLSGHAVLVKIPT